MPALNPKIAFGFETSKTIQNVLLQPPKARFEWFLAANKQKNKDREILVWLFKECPTLNPKVASADFNLNKTMQNVLLEAAKARFD